MEFTGSFYDLIEGLGRERINFGRSGKVPSVLFAELAVRLAQDRELFLCLFLLACLEEGEGEVQAGLVVVLFFCQSFFVRG